MENRVPGVGGIQDYKLLPVRLEEEKNSCWRLCFCASKTNSYPSRRLICLSLQSTCLIVVFSLPL